MKSHKKCKLGVLVSGSGTNLQAILDESEDSSYPAQVALVISNQPDAFALTRAQQHGVPILVISHKNFASRKAFEDALIEALDKADVDLVILAGFMRVLSPHFVQHYPHKVLNLHPALLPAFPGIHGIQEAWDYGVKVTGVTVHFVDEGTDTGPIVLQEVIEIDPKETLESLEEKVHSVEHRLLPEAIKLFAEGRLKVEGRKVLLC